MNYKNFDSVLALASKPKAKQSILDWRPFGKNTLDEIISKHNEDYEDELKKIPWPTNLIEERGRFINVANYDLSEVDTIDLTQFVKIRFIFANLGEISGASLAVEQVKASMNYARREYWLAQISRKPLQPSERARFTPSPVHFSRPEVIADQYELEQWLASLYWYYKVAASEGTPPPPGDRGGAGEGPGGTGDSSLSAKFDIGKFEPGSWTSVFMNYRPYDLFATSEGGEGAGLQRSLTDIASDVSDIAFEKDFSEEETRALARKAMIQEKVLGDVSAFVLNNIDLKTDDELDMDFLRKPIQRMTFDDKYLERTNTVELLTVKLAKPVTTLSKGQCALCEDLHLNKKSSLIVLASHPETLKKIGILKGAVETHSMHLTLPFDATEMLSLDWRENSRKNVQTEKSKKRTDFGMDR